LATLLTIAEAAPVAIIETVEAAPPAPVEIAAPVAEIVPKPLRRRPPPSPPRLLLRRSRPRRSKCPARANRSSASIPSASTA
jgi:hypothetical protein